MPIYESNFQGLLFSPIVLMIVFAAVVTSFATRMIDRAIPYSMQRNESLMSMLLFMVILMVMVSFTF